MLHIKLIRLFARFIFAYSMLVVGFHFQQSMPSILYAQPSPINQEYTSTPVYSGIVADHAEQPDKPVFSVEPGFYTSELELEITHPDPDVILYYTTDGSEPTENSSIYQSPILLQDPSDQPNNISTIPTNIEHNWRLPQELVKKANVIRVKAVKPGGETSDTVTGTWIIDPAGRDRYSMRVVSVVTDSVHFFSDETGIYVPGIHYSPGNFPWSQQGNFTQRGREWERPINLEIFDENGELFLSQNAGARIHGGVTRATAQKSLRLYARSDYGESRFNAQIFPELDDNRFNRLILRNSGNDWGHTLFRDAAAQSLVRHLNIDTQAYHPAIVFINGEYWGIHNFRERYDRHYLERVYGVDPDNIDLLEQRNTVQEGDNTHYNQMIDFLETRDLSDDALFAEVETMMDMDNFLDYYSAQIYYANADWPHNNIDFWRLRTPYSPHAPPGHDGRWRWLLYDVDFSLGLNSPYTYNMMEHLTGTGHNDLQWPNTILNNLLENETFKHQFINRIADHLNTAFMPERVHHVIDSLKTKVEPEIAEHIERWRHPPRVSRWEEHVEVMITAATHRPEIVRQHVVEHFELDTLAYISVDVNNPERGTVHVNSIAIDPSTPGIEHLPWTGIYFQDIPVALRAEPRPGYRFSHWSGDISLIKGNHNTENPTVQIIPSGTATIIAHFREELPGESDPRELIHYWVFTNELANDTPLDVIPSTFSATTNAKIEYHPAISPYPPESGTEGIMDRVNDPTELNYRPGGNHDIPFEESDMRGIRVRNPSLVNNQESSLVFYLPTTGYEQIEFSFPTVRTESGQREIIIEYNVDGNNESWMQEGLEHTTVPIFETWNLNTFSFSNIEGANDNPNFRIRVRFGGDEEIRRGDSGNVRFNNILLEGVSLDDGPGRPAEGFALHQNMPNPFQSTTTIGYQLDQDSNVLLEVYDLLGRKIATLIEGVQHAGNHFVEFDASPFASGVYIYRLQAGDKSEAKKMMLIK